MPSKAETDMIATNEDVKMEDQIRTIVKQSVFLFLFFFLCHSMPLLVYTQITIILLRYSSHRY